MDCEHQQQNHHQEVRQPWFASWNARLLPSFQSPEEGDDKASEQEEEEEPPPLSTTGGLCLPNRFQANHESSVSWSPHTTRRSSRCSFPLQPRVALSRLYTKNYACFLPYRPEENPRPPPVTAAVAAAQSLPRRLRNPVELTPSSYLPGETKLSAVAVVHVWRRLPRPTPLLAAAAAVLLPRL